jgi:hypothetical protein
VSLGKAFSHVPTVRSRTTADIRREIEATEQRFRDLVARWQSSGTSASLGTAQPSRESVDRIEELLRNQRGTLDRLHQLWIEYAQALGQHAPQ